MKKTGSREETRLGSHGPIFILKWFLFHCQVQVPAFLVFLASPWCKEEKLVLPASYLVPVLCLKGKRPPGCTAHVQLPGRVVLVAANEPRNTCEFWGKFLSLTGIAEPGARGSIWLQGKVICDPGNARLLPMRL